MKRESEQRFRKVVDWSSGKVKNDSSGEAGGKEEKTERGREGEGEKKANRDETREAGRVSWRQAKCKYTEYI